MSPKYAHESKYINHIEIYETLLLIIINDHRCYWLNWENDNVSGIVYVSYLFNHYNSFQDANDERYYILFRIVHSLSTLIKYS